MKTFLAFTAASAQSRSIRTDRPQRLPSVAVYWRGRKMTLMQRPQRRLSLLLRAVLRRAFHALLGTSMRAIAAAAMATAALNAHADIANTTLPTGYSVAAGNVHVRTYHGDHMVIRQNTDKAILNWNSFSIGSDASVRFIQKDANSVALNRVLGNDPSIIMGRLSANGKVFLINAAGIMVGKNAKINVAGFTASTLNISDSDFLANRLTFKADPGTTPGVVRNEGNITAGSVYLVGSSVQNSGVINAPNGEVLLAAGSTVQLLDTNTPGVTIEVTGAEGNVTNLGQILASAGTIGIGAALINNTGTINASSIEKEGGRIFLRASKALTTGTTSDIRADGATGGKVTLYSDQLADIGGNVSALGSAGHGGYVDTSGKTSLAVKYAPKVGPGGEWYIDPYDVEIVASDGGGVGDGGVITADEGHSKFLASSIQEALNGGANVTISTGGSDSAGSDNGDITVNAAINKSGGGAATLSLYAANSIVLNAGITDTTGPSDGLSLTLSAYNGSITESPSGNIGLSHLTAHAHGDISLDAMTNNVSNNSVGSFEAYSKTGNVNFKNNGGLQLESVIARNGSVEVATAGDLTASRHSIIAKSVDLTAAATGDAKGDITLEGNVQATDAAGTGVTLNSAGSIHQFRGQIIASKLTANAVEGIALNRSNEVHAFTASNAGIGDITLNNRFAVELGDITDTGAGTLVSITAQNGAITQSQTGAIRVYSLKATTQVAHHHGNAHHAGDIVLDGDNNAIENFAANARFGDITLKNNNARSTGTLNLGAISTGNGSISIENWGAMITGGHSIVAHHGGVSLKTHSPLTIGTGGVRATGDIVLAAGSTVNPALQDNLVIGGNVTSFAGNVAISAGNSVTANAFIRGNSVAVSSPSYVSNVTQPETVVYTHTNPFVPTPPSHPISIPTGTTDHNLDTTSSSINLYGGPNASLPSSTTTTALNTASNGQTVGGEAGFFGGGDAAADDKKDKDTKAAMMYCN